MVGLERGTVELVPYQKKWTALYEQEVERLSETAGDWFLDFEHIGSTAIEGMPAKPIVDILAVVNDLDEAEALVSLLKEYGYEYRPGEVEGRLFFAKGPRTNRTIYLSVTEGESDFYEEKIVFRDYLRGNAKTAEEYASLKARLAEEYPKDRQKYTAEKSDFIQAILDEAINE